MPVNFNLYSSEGCHLCEQAYELCQQAGITEALNVIDIVENQQYAEQYGIHIPVLERKSDGQQLFWPFSLSQIQALKG